MGFTVETLTSKPSFYSIDCSTQGDKVTSVAIFEGLLAVSVSTGTANGKVIFVDITEGKTTILGHVEVGSQPGQVVFSKTGNFIMTPNEGSPNKRNNVDPLGTISVLRLKSESSYLPFTAENLLQHTMNNIEVTTLNFEEFNDPATRDKTVRYYGEVMSKQNTFAIDVEPEYIAIADNECKAWVSLQEANAIAEIDLINLKIVSVTGLFKDYSRANKIDASRSDGINIRNWPLFGMYQPAEIYYFQSSCQKDYLLVANEGDDRNDSYDETKKLKHVILDASKFGDMDLSAIGDLRISLLNADTDDDGDIDVLYTIGGRSIGVYDIELRSFVWESGSQLEEMLAKQPNAEISFNSDNSMPGTFDSRSSKRGMEPKGISIAKIRGKMYAFVSLKQQGGFVVYDITDPQKPRFIHYANNRNFEANWDRYSFKDIFSLDLGPEGLTFLPKGTFNLLDSPALVVANSVSGTVTLHAIDVHWAQ